MPTSLILPLPDIAPPQRALIVHADENWHRPIARGHVDFFEKLAQVLGARGVPIYLVAARDPRSASLLDGQYLHILIGPRRPKGARIFHVFPAYIKGFWYLDPQGYFWNSSLMGQVFDPEAVDPAAAKTFFDRVSQRRISGNISQRAQPAPSPLPPAQVAVFAQDIETYPDPVHFLTTRAMIRAASAGAAGLCYVKPHPKMTEKQRAWLAKLCARLGNTRLIDASVHDLIAAAQVVVSQNSAVGVEALLHRKPVITCAKTDYAGATIACKTESDLRAAIAQAPAHFAGFPFDRYLYWFLGLNMVQPNSDTFAARCLQILYGDRSP